MNPFRFGVSVWHAPSRAEWIAKARKIEDLGYSSLMLPDHLLTERVAPMPALVSAAEATKRILVGTYVLNNDLRHPVVLAREAAAVDLLTDGRLQLGLGAGWNKAEYDQAGLTFNRGGIRVERLAEAVVIIRRLLAGEQVTFAGRHYRVSGHVLAPLPVQKPHPPIIIGGKGPRLLTLAAQQADIVGLTGMTFRRGGTELDNSGWTGSAVDECIALIRAAATEERFARLELNALVQRVVVSDDRRGAVEALNRVWPQLSAADILENPYVLVGTVDQIVQDLCARRARWGISYYVVHEPYMDAFAPVVARLAGK
jgi:probable F420-dependent oxidoreductase